MMKTLFEQNEECCLECEYLKGYFCKRARLLGKNFDPLNVCCSSFIKKQKKFIQKPIECINYKCGAVCSLSDAESCNNNPHKCHKYKYSPELYEDENESK